MIPGQGLDVPSLAASKINYQLAGSEIEGSGSNSEHGDEAGPLMCYLHRGTGFSQSQSDRRQLSLLLPVSR